MKLQSIRAKHCKTVTQYALYALRQMHSVRCKGTSKQHYEEGNTNSIKEPLTRNKHKTTIHY